VIRLTSGRTSFRAPRFLCRKKLLAFLRSKIPCNDDQSFSCYRSGSPLDDRGWLIAGGLLSVFVGFLAIGSPLFFSIVVAQFLGAFALVSGVIALGLAAPKSAAELPVRFSAFLLLWPVLDGVKPAGLLIGLPAAALSAWISILLFPPSRSRPRLMALLSLGWHFLRSSVAAGVDVANRGCHRKSPIRRPGG
jgi:uncharacterized membrane protein HdeD (DUF308 family)